MISEWAMREEGMDDEGGATALASASTPHWMARGTCRKVIASGSHGLGPRCATVELALF